MTYKSKPEFQPIDLGLHMGEKRGEKRESEKNNQMTNDKNNQIQTYSPPLDLIQQPLARGSLAEIDNLIKVHNENKLKAQMGFMGQLLGGRTLERGESIEVMLSGDVGMKWSFQ